MQFEYTKSTFLEGLQTVLIFLSTMPILFYVFYSFVPDQPMRAISLTFIVTASILILGYSIVNFKSNSQFKLVITNGRIKQISPSKLCAKTFEITIKDITKIRIEKNKYGDSPNYKFFIITKNNDKSELTSNYSNPRKQIVAILLNNYNHIDLEEVEV